MAAQLTNIIFSSFFPISHAHFIRGILKLHTECLLTLGTSASLVCDVLLPAPPRAAAGAERPAEREPRSAACRLLAASSLPPSGRDHAQPFQPFRSFLYVRKCMLPGCSINRLATLYPQAFQLPKPEVFSEATVFTSGRPWGLKGGPAVHS